MENKIIARQFKLLAQLLEFHGENTFKVAAIDKAARTLGKLPFQISLDNLEELSRIQGVGKSIAAKVRELLEEGTLKELTQLKETTPPGILKMLGIKGLGAKKVAIIWKELGIDNLGDLWHACEDGKLSPLKGFGKKTEAEIQQIVEFTLANEKKFRYADVEKTAIEVLDLLKKLSGKDALVSFTGDYRRNMEVLECLEFLVAMGPTDLLVRLKESSFFEALTEKEESISATHSSGFPVCIFRCEKTDYYARLTETTGNEKHVDELRSLFPSGIPRLSSEELIYKEAGLSYIPPEQRQGNIEITLAKKKQLPKLITESDLKGNLHNHSTWSDGVFSVETMALHCRDVLKLDYFGISDHSKTAVYADGLKINEVKQQWGEIDALNEKLAPFRIFKGIESDILADGSLDYPDDILAGFDFVVASIHSQLAMDEKKATERLIKAIENPYTTILGHPTGRQLLFRKGYPIDHKKVIDACAANQVVIEINSNPLRLDIDWRWIPYCLERGVKLSINPDAHHTAELGYTHFGVLIARKGGLTAENCLNCMSVDDLDHFFKAHKPTIIP